MTSTVKHTIDPKSFSVVGSASMITGQACVGSAML